MLKGPVKVKCRKCGRESDSDKFILDSYYKMLVCNQCVQEKKTILAKEHQAKAAEPRPQPSAPQQREQAPADPNKTKYTCKKCAYVFTYNIATRTPSHCPYCNREVNM